MMKAFLFDLDGLLVDSEPLHFEAFLSTCKGMGFIIPWDFETYCKKAHTQSMGLKKAFLELFPDAERHWPELYHSVKLKFAHLVQNTPLHLMPGVSEFLDILLRKQKLMAVVTNSSTPMAYAILQKQPLLKKIPLWITREDYLNAKPMPDGYITALKTLGVGPHHAVGFEDSPRGIKALKAAEVTAVHISPFSLNEAVHFQDFTHFIQSQKRVELVGL